jgi:hypothetical protein
MSRGIQVLRMLGCDTVLFPVPATPLEPLERLLLLHMQQMTARLLNRARDPTTLSARAPISHQSLLIHCRDRGRECLSNRNHSDLRRLGDPGHPLQFAAGQIVIFMIEKSSSSSSEPWTSRANWRSSCSSDEPSGTARVRISSKASNSSMDPSGRTIS